MAAAAATERASSNGSVATGIHSSPAASATARTARPASAAPVATAPRPPGASRPARPGGVGLTALAPHEALEQEPRAGAGGLQATRRPARSPTRGCRAGCRARPRAPDPVATGARSGRDRRGAPRGGRSTSRWPCRGDGAPRRRPYRERAAPTRGWSRGGRAPPEPSRPPPGRACRAPGRRCPQAEGPPDPHASPRPCQDHGAPRRSGSGGFPPAPLRPSALRTTVPRCRVSSPPRGRAAARPATARPLPSVHPRCRAPLAPLVPSSASVSRRDGTDDHVARVSVQVGSRRAMSDDQVVVVGAGPAGLSAALALNDLGLRPLVVDRATEVGSSWRGRYDRLRLNTSRALSTCPTGAFRRARRCSPPATSSSTTSSATRARGFELLLGTDVARIDPDDGSWEVATSKGELTARQSSRPATRARRSRRTGAVARASRGP